MKALLLLLSACHMLAEPLANDICSDSLSNQQVIDCVVNSLNEALGCEQFAENGEGKITNKYTQATVEISFQDQEVRPGFEGFAENACNTWRIQIERKADAPWLAAPVLLHEIGHTMGLRFADNPSDPIHSLRSTEIMYSTAGTLLTPDTLRVFAAQALSSGPICGATAPTNCE